MPTLKLTWLGFPQIELDGQPVKTDRRKAVALLAVLSLAQGAQRREQLSALFWPEFDASRASAYLRRTLWEINQMIGGGWLRTNRDEIALEFSSGLQVDVLEFETLTEQGLAGTESGSQDRFQTLDRAAALYRGDFLAGFSLRDSLEFDEWQQQRSESLKLKMQAVLERLVFHAGEVGDYQAAVEYASRWVSMDSLNESAQRALITAYARSGQRSAALRQYEQCAKLLQNELGVGPEEETVRLVDKIRSGEIASTPGKNLTREIRELQPVPSLPLPEYPGVFLGREAEMDDIATLLEANECRLITLLGPGGSGKTRLAVEVGRRNAARFPHGIGFVHLAPIREVESILAAIGRAIHLTYRSPGEEQIPTTDLQEQLIDYLREKQFLLILDNWEHLLPGAGLMSEILAKAPGVKILATSRERLNLPEEWVFDVRGLAYPSQPTSEGLESYSAFQLFIQSARRLNTGFAPDPSQQVCIGEVCRALEGLPLAIELAASWVRLLDCCEIAAEIRRNIDFLETSLRGVPERHRSLRAVFDHSWALLSQLERDALMRLSVFRGGFTREAAAGATGAPLDILASLLDKSLITRDSSGRYWMHEAIKQFSAQHLDSIPVLASQTRDAHSAYYLEWLISARMSGASGRQREFLRSFDLEIENIGAACLWAISQQKWEILIQTLPVLYLFQDTSSSYRSAAEAMGSAVEKIREFLRSRPADEEVLTVYVMFLGLYARSLLAYDQINEYRSLASEGYALLNQLPPSVPKAWALTLYGFGFFIAEKAEILTNIRRAYEWFEQSNERRGMAIALSEWANQLDQKEHQTTSQEAIARLKQAIEWMEELNDPWMRARMLNDLARVHNFHGEYLQARGYLLEALSIFEELGEIWPVVDVRFNLGQNATWLGEYELAEGYFNASLEFLRNMGSGPYYGAHLDCLGYLAYLQKDYPRAKSYYEESLAVYQRSKYTAGILMVFNNLGDIARASGDLNAAIDYYQKGIALLPEDGEYWGRSILVKNLGTAWIVKGELDEAEKYLREAQRYAMLIERVPDILEIDMSGARLFALRGDFRRAQEILAMVSQHPAATQVVRDAARTLLEELRAEAPMEETFSAIERGKRLEPGCAFQTAE